MLLGLSVIQKKNNLRAEELWVLVVNPELMLYQLVVDLEQQEGEVQVYLHLQHGEPHPSGCCSSASTSHLLIILASTEPA